MGRVVSLVGMVLELRVGAYFCFEYLSSRVAGWGLGRYSGFIFGFVRGIFCRDFRIFFGFFLIGIRRLLIGLYRFCYSKGGILRVRFSVFFSLV